MYSRWTSNLGHGGMPNGRWAWSAVSRSACVRSTPWSKARRSAFLTLLPLQISAQAEPREEDQESQGQPVAHSRRTDHRISAAVSVSASSVDSHRLQHQPQSQGSGNVGSKGLRCGVRRASNRLPVYRTESCWNRHGSCATTRTVASGLREPSWLSPCLPGSPARGRVMMSRVRPLRVRPGESEGRAPACPAVPPLHDDRDAAVANARS